MLESVAKPLGFNCAQVTVVLLVSGAAGVADAVEGFAVVDGVGAAGGGIRHRTFSVAAALADAETSFCWPS